MSEFLVVVAFFALVGGLIALFLTMRKRAIESPEEEEKVFVNVQTRRGLRPGVLVGYDRSGRAIVAHYGRAGMFVVRRSPAKVIFLVA